MAQDKITLPPCPHCGEVNWVMANDELRTYTTNQEGVLVQRRIEMLTETIQCSSCDFDPLYAEGTWFDDNIYTLREAYNAADKEEL